MPIDQKDVDQAVQIANKALKKLAKNESLTIDGSLLPAAVASLAGAILIAEAQKPQGIRD